MNHSSWTQAQVANLVVGSRVRYLGAECAISKILTSGKNYKGLESKVVRIDRPCGTVQITATITEGHECTVVAPASGRVRLVHPDTVTVTFEDRKAAAGFLWNFRSLPNFDRYVLQDEAAGVELRPVIGERAVSFQ